MSNIINHITKLEKIKNEVKECLLERICDEYSQDQMCELLDEYFMEGDEEMILEWDIDVVQDFTMYVEATHGKVSWL